MPYGNPKHVKPWEREYWPQLNKGQKLYSIQEWQCYRIRQNLNPEEINEHVCEELEIPFNWVSNKARRLINTDNAGQEIQSAVGSPRSETSTLHGFPDPDDPTPETIRRKQRRRV
jgi:hypothetical protein